MPQYSDALDDRLEQAISEQWIELIPSPKWVRVLFNGKVVADSKGVQMLRERGHTPVYYFPKEDVRTDVLLPSSHTSQSPSKGEASYFTVKVGDKVAKDAAWAYGKVIPNIDALKDYVAFEWDKMDAWFEESEEVFVHPRDPYKRIDVQHSSRHVRVVIAGETVAESDNPVLLFETGLPTRYYLRKVDVQMDLLVPSETVTRCPYKGEAHYYSVAVGGQDTPDVAWYYIYPTTETSKIAGLISFYNERVDALYVDGQLQPKPKTKWSR